MDGYRKEGQINWLWSTIYGYSFLRVIFKDYGYFTDTGIILVADDERQARRFVTEYCQKTDGNGCNVKGWNQRSKYPANFCCCFMILQKKAKECELVSFLEESGFFPIIVCGGIIPEYLRTQHLFRVKREDLEELCDNDFAMHLADFRGYILRNVPEICRILEKHQSSVLMTEYEGELSVKPLYSIFSAVGKVYAAYLRTSKSEREVFDFLKSYMQETMERLNLMSEFASGEELPELFSSLVVDYMKKNKDIILTDEERLSGKLGMLLNEGKIIFFDERFYYFPPKLFREIMEPLLQTSSETELKKRLKEAGILYCNSADYTVKKEFISVYGVNQRTRLLWISKESIYSKENLRLEDLFPVYTEEEM